VKARAERLRVDLNVSTQQIESVQWRSFDAIVAELLNHYARAEEI
jgi:hypothetical protein